jgi:hypothetical protein
MGERMHELVAAALESQDYRRAAQLIKQWKKAAPKDPIMMLSVARLQEATLQWDAAERTYLQFLKYVNNAKLMGQAREGLKRVQQHREAVRQEALAEARAVLGSDDPGLLLLEPPGDRQVAAQGLAEVLRIDPYMARMQLPSRGMRLQRLGPIGELQYFGESLQQVGVPTTWVKTDEVKAIQTFQVQFFRSLQPKPTVVCQSGTGQLGTIQFDWSEITQQVRGQLPIFEQVADLGPWGKPRRKEQTQDYAQVLDLHLHGRRSILRVCDRTYEFSKSMDLVAHPPQIQAPPTQVSSRMKWNALLQYIQQTVTVPVHADFTNFGQGALEFIDLLPYINPNLDLNRRAPSNWDQAFHLYSAIHF